MHYGKRLPPQGFLRVSLASVHPSAYHSNVDVLEASTKRGQARERQMFFFLLIPLRVETRLKLEEIMACPKTLYVVSSLVRIFPDKPEPEYGALKASISRLGLLDPILMWRGTVVDGYHRLRACLELGIEPRFDVLSDGADPMEIVTDRMSAQRHLNETARAAAAVRALGKPKPGRPKGSGKNRANLRSFRTRRWASEKFRVSERTITTMLKIADPHSGAISEVRRALNTGLISANDGLKALQESPELQREAMNLIFSGGAKKFAGAVSMIRNDVAQAEFLAPEEVLKAAASGGFVLHHSTVAGLKDLVGAGTVDAIVTFPPAGEGNYHRIADLGEFAVHSLKDTGAVFLLASTEDLPELMKHMGREPLTWVCAFHYSHPGNNYRHNSVHTIPLTQKLLLIFGKPGFRLNAGYEPITVPPLAEGTGREYFSPRLDVGMEMIIERFTLPHHTLADPLMARRDQSTLAARKLGRSFIGAWEDRAFIDHLRTRLGLVSGESVT